MTFVLSGESVVTVEANQTWEGCLKEVKTTFIENHIDLNREQNFTFFLTFGDKESAHLCCDRLMALSYQTSLEGPGPIFGDYLCFTRVTFAPSEKAFSTFLQQWLSICDVSNGEYEGWEVNSDATAIAESDYLNIAQEMLETVRSSIQPHHDYTQIDAANFKHLDLDFYQQHQAELEVLGFIFMCDIEDQTIPSITSEKTFIRVMTHPQSFAVAAFYFLPSENTGALEFESLLTDGHVVSHINLNERNELAKWPNISQTFLPDSPTSADLYASHVASLDESSNSTVPVDNYQALIDMQNTMNAHKHEYLENIGWITRSFLEKQTFGDEKMVEGVLKAVNKILSEEALVP